jgi:hypothetical protein
MDVPILTAVISVSGALLGTIVGGCLTMYSNFFLNRRRERAEFRIGCRLIAGELWESEGLLNASLEAKRWWPSEIEPGTKAWEDHRHVLAAYLSYEAWQYVLRAVRVIHMAHHLSTAAQKKTPLATIDDDIAPKLAVYLEGIREGRASLQPYLRERFIGATLHQAGHPRTTRAGTTT